MRRLFVYIRFWILILTAGLSAGGCNRTVRQAPEIVFSSDGHTLAYLWRVNTLSGRFEEYYHIGRKWEYLCYRSTEDSATPRCKRLRYTDRSPAFLAEYKARGLSISPDGRRLAYILRGRLFVLDTDTDKARPLTGRNETIRSARWTGPNELAYVCETEEDSCDGCTIRTTVWVHPVDDERRDLYTTLHREDSPPVESFFSPDGRFVLLIEPVTLRIVDLERRKARGPISRRSGKQRGVCWSPDGERVFVAFGWGQKQEGPDGAILLHAPTNAVTDYSDKFRDFYGTNPFRVWDWTVDGKYLVAFNLRLLQVHLIELEPWRTIRFEKKYDSNLPKEYGDVKIVRSLAPGWLWVRPNREGTTYAMDYGGRRVIPIATNNWAVSADFSTIVEVVNRHTVDIRPLELPELPPLPDKDADEEFLQPPPLFEDSPQTRPATQPTEPTSQPVQPPPPTGENLVMTKS